MTETDAARSLRDDFLARLDAAMKNVPHGVASEIRGGIVEELDGLDTEATAARIAELGEPQRIAEEAEGDAHVVAPPVVTALPPKQPLAQSRKYAIAAALVFAFGGFVVPVVGWIVGVVMVGSSALWHRWEKAVAIALPFAAAALIAVMTWIGDLISTSGEGEGQEHNPLVPSMSGLGLWHSGILLAFILIPVVGGWLLWRLRRR